MDKRYQVFVSSTFTDLEEERKHVIQTLMEMDCIPAGMELFPAIDEEQWEFIKKIIDDCDYYLLIIGGRYGSIAEDGLSYTEKEFDYAIEKGLRVVVLVHENPETLPLAKSERSDETREKLLKFIDKASTGRLRKTWSSPKDIPGLVSLNMSKTIKTYPAVGWVRADKISNETDLRRLIELQQENDALRKELKDAGYSNNNYDGIVAPLESKFEINYTLSPIGEHYENPIQQKWVVSWRDLFQLLSPYIFKAISSSEILSKITNEIDRDTSYDFSVYVKESDIQTIELQFIALGLMTLAEDKWTLTPKGISLMMELKVVKL
ncbi:hypothetical protein ERHA54_33110 [Erwinia rhapontici]|uniref:DUF4062 domain-containing protein n=1 Tax=Erwinia rhapontici TaxID=55212 RepID=A0ABN6DM45_ERWRD|nr:DUF4062 domain-containing protein [Erwinia rhapontici]BCQ35796.1 hypothetical protein ERHA53_31390 [Erwinia rhapontici]BCQ40708.1 hypothetical protein ERHA54_33110 [Erwinia rhapontici]BCQ46003.1 hypothetical protein ERHA55_35300 [Erwinia rhapontici]